MSKQNELLQKLLDITAQLEERKALYGELDAIVLALREQGFEHAVFAGKDITIVDNFKEKNVAWRMAAVHQYEAKIKEAK